VTYILQAIIREDFNRIYEGEANIDNDKQLLKLLVNLKHKGVDLFKIMERGIIDEDDGWL